MRWLLASSMPIAEGGTSCVGTATTEPTEAIALDDAPQRSSHVVELALGRIFNGMMSINVVVPIVVMRG